MTDDRSPLPWKQRRTPMRGTRRARNWRKLHPGYQFPGTTWKLIEGPYKRIHRDRYKAFAYVECVGCGQRYERRLDHLVHARSKQCVDCYRSKGRTEADTGT